MRRRIAHITDAHLDEKEVAEKGIDARRNFLAILDDVGKRDVDDILFAGDIGENLALEWFFKTMYTCNPRLKIILGNHDAYNEVLKYYNDYYNQGFGELYHSNEDEHFKYLYLDSSSYAISQKQFDWFVKEVCTVKPIILFIHHPVLPVETEMDHKYPLKERERMLDVLQQHKNHVYIFCGHYHAEDKLTEGNITQFVTPATSFQVLKQTGIIEFDTVRFGYRIIDINEGEIESEVVWFISGKHEQ